MGECVFCKIAAGDAPAEIVAQWEDALAFRPLGPVAEGHLLVIPRQHVADFTVAPVLTSYVTMRAAGLVQSLPEAEGWNLITSAGDAATQTVMHLHIHLVPRRPADGLALPWTPPVELAPGLTVDRRTGPHFEGQPMEVIGMGTKGRGTDKVEAELHLITRAERARRLDAAEARRCCGRGGP